MSKNTMTVNKDVVMTSLGQCTKKASEAARIAPREGAAPMQEQPEGGDALSGGPAV